ncbi:MAG: ABC transporter permease [Rhodospirillaceae bacterium]|nr:ABC transporter permease [Rhodospirillaceae bacterium]MDE0360136.1 ABC transporter permease [Rhodospirillaceae bacterium]
MAVTRFPFWFAATEAVRAALGSIRAHGFRSFLTTLGIVIGVASVIGMVSIIQGLSFAIGEQLQGLGSNGITVQSYTPVLQRLQGRRARLTQEDLDLISYRVDGIDSITPIMYSQGGQSRIRYGSRTALAWVLGTTYPFQDIGGYFSRHGRFLSDSDNRTRRRVAVVAEQTREDLGLPENPVGEFIQVNEEWLRVIGLPEPKGEILGQQLDNRVMIPYSTMVSMLGNQRSPDIQIQLTVADLNEMDTVVRLIARLLRNAHGLQPDEPDDFRIQTAEQVRATFDTIINTMTIAMGGIVGISLLVGGIGIMNIMLVSVTERTREIGICKAIGATRQHILLQFLIEALFLCLLGGLAGLVAGYGIGAVAASFIPGFPAAHTPVWSIALALGFSLAVGMIFGILPAVKAANLDPISALRYE